MKTPQKQNSNWKLIPALFIGLLFITLNANSQAIAEKVGFSGEEISNTFDINEFSATQGGSKIYFRFLIKEDRDNVNYVLESSLDGIDYNTIQLKEGFKSPYGQPLLYCYSLESNTTTDSKYRIRMSTPEGDSFSDIIEHNPVVNLELTAQKN